MIFWIWLALAISSLVWAARSLVRKRWHTGIIALLVLTNLLTGAAWFLESLAHANLSANLKATQEKVKQLQSSGEALEPQEPEIGEADNRGNVLYVDGYVRFEPSSSVPRDAEHLDAQPVFASRCSLDLTDEQVEELREKLKWIRFPAPKGATASVLSLPESKSRESWLNESHVFPDGDEWACSGSSQRWWVLNSRFCFILAEGDYFNADGRSETLETRALIVEEKSSDVDMKWRLSSPGKLSAKAASRALEGRVVEWDGPREMGPADARK